MQTERGRGSLTNYLGWFKSELVEGKLSLHESDRAKAINLDRVESFEHTEHTLFNVDITNFLLEAIWHSPEAWPPLRIRPEEVNVWQLERNLVSPTLEEETGRPLSS
ncbi:hypothetical protein RRG08_024477 [Elysia crispata]|uniref:Uncharacterized protein n=1 Tax=Elysia crispata TaxID=231223 RepID=A0AAE0YPL9_9GAST|nr:hypothetical protein RRG08_024477 [Elysia crispata]